MLRNISKALNTSNFYYDSKNFKDVTISNQQVAKHIKHVLVPFSRLQPYRYAKRPKGEGALKGTKKKRY